MRRAVSFSDGCATPDGTSPISVLAADDQRLVRA
jgi:hypothetical protein